MRTLWPYADDDVIITEIKKALKTFKDEANEINIYRNALDPFSAMFDMALQGSSFENWIDQEKLRQAQKTLQNAVGYFHQGVLGGVDGWVDTGEGGGYDLCNDKRKIIVELKNKFNTFNSTSAGGTYRKMARYLDGEKKGYTGYVVTIIHSSPRRISRPFAPSEPGEYHPRRNDLTKVDGASFYTIATGDHNALKLLYECLPKAIEVAVPQLKVEVDSSKDFKELFLKTFGD